MTAQPMAQAAAQRPMGDAGCAAQPTAREGSGYAAQPAVHQEHRPQPAQAVRAAEQPMESVSSEQPVQASVRPAERGFAEPRQPQPAEHAAVQAAAESSAGSAVQQAGGAAAAGAGSGSVSAQLAASLSNPAALQRLWQAALTTLKKEKAAYGVLFLNTKAVFEPSANALSIEFPAENTFAFKAAQKPDVQAAVASALMRACGEQLAFSYVQAGNRVAAGGAAAGEAAQPQPSREQPRAEMAAEPINDRGGFDSAGDRPVREDRRAEAATHPAYGERRAESEQARPAAHDQRAAATGMPVAQEQRYDAVPSSPSYDDVVPYDDDAVPYDDAAAMSYDVPPWEDAAPARRVETRPRAEQSAPHRQDEQSAPRPQAEQAAAPTRAEQPDSSAQATPDDLQAILAAGFGDGVTFQEVRE